MTYVNKVAVIFVYQFYMLSIYILIYLAIYLSIHLSTYIANKFYMHGQLFHVKKNRRKLYKGEICMHFFLIIHAEVTILEIR